MLKVTSTATLIKRQKNRIRE